MTLERWLEEWEEAVESGQSSISREEAVKRWEKWHKLEDPTDLSREEYWGDK